MQLKLKTPKSTRKSTISILMANIETFSIMPLNFTGLHVECFSRKNDDFMRSPMRKLHSSHLVRVFLFTSSLLIVLLVSLLIDIRDRVLGIMDVFPISI